MVEPSVATRKDSDLSSLKFPNNNQGFELIASFIDRYNQSCSDDQKLDSEVIITKLKNAGAVNDELLKQLSAKEIEEVASLSQIVSKGICAELKSLSNSQSSSRPQTIPSRYRVQAYALKELVKQYDPKEIGGNVTTELLRRVNDTINRNPSIIVFKKDGSVDAEVSYNLLEEALQGDPDLEQAESDGRMAFTFKIGQKQDQVVNLHPITGEALRANGMDADGYNWLEVPLKARQLIHLAVQEDEISEDISPLELESIRPFP